MATIRTSFFLAVWTILWALYGVAVLVVGDRSNGTFPVWLVYLPLLLVTAMVTYGTLCGTLVSRRRLPLLGLLLGVAFGSLGGAAAYLIMHFTGPPLYLLAGLLGGLLIETGVNLAAEQV
jgi:hypothetical protein